MLICPIDVNEAEDPGYEELDESMTVPEEAPRGMAVPETPSAKEREGHELLNVVEPEFLFPVTHTRAPPMKPLKSP